MNDWTCVNPKMGLKLILLRKSLVAKIAHVWAFTFNYNYYALCFAKSYK